MTWFTFDVSVVYGGVSCGHFSVKLIFLLLPVLSGLQWDTLWRRPQVSVRDQQTLRDSDWTDPGPPKGARSGRGESEPAQRQQHNILLLCIFDYFVFLFPVLIGVAWTCSSCSLCSRAHGVKALWPFHCSVFCWLTATWGTTSWASWPSTCGTSATNTDTVRLASRWVRAYAHTDASSKEL